MAAVVGNGKGVRSSVSRGAHVNIRIGSQAETPLIRAVYLGRTDAATALLNAGADVEETNSNGQTLYILPLDRAFESGAIATHRANIDARTLGSQRPFSGRSPTPKLSSIIRSSIQRRVSRTVSKVAFQVVAVSA